MGKESDMGERKDGVKQAQWRHFFLYGKNRYRKTETMGDLKKILSHETGVSLAEVRPADVYEILLGLFLKHTTECEKRGMFLKMFSERESVKIGDMIRYLLDTLKMVKVRDGDDILIDLGEPDPSVLPVDYDTT
jgi:hypothetical protein